MGGIFLAFILVAVAIAILFQRSNVSKSDDAGTLTQNIAWEKPDPQNFWSSLEFFAQLGEMRSQRSEEVFLYIKLVQRTNEELHTQKGQFGITMFEFKEWSRFFCDKIHNLKGLHNNDVNGFEGMDAETTALNLSAERICELIASEAPHAYLKGSGVYKDGTFITIHFHTHP